MILAVGMTARIAVAAPRAAVAALRAAVCCAEHCPKQRAPMPKRCCMVESAATDPASTAFTPSLERPAAVGPAIVVSPPAIEIAPQAIVSIEQLRLRAGPPGHPETQKLRC